MVSSRFLNRLFPIEIEAGVVFVALMTNGMIGNIWRQNLFCTEKV